MILVTGATGTIGRHVVAELQARGEPFRVAHRNAAHVREVLGPEVNSVPFDYLDQTTYLPAMQSADTLFLLTPTADWAHERAMAVIDAAREAGVQKIVRQSALHADANPTYTLAEWHREVELYLVASAIPGTILRPNHFMENFREYMGETIRSQGKFYSSSGDGRMSYVSGRDVAAVAAECLVDDEHTGKSYDLTGPEAFSLRDAAAILSRATGRRIEYVPVDEQQVREAMFGAPDWLVQVALELEEFDRQGEMSPVNNNIEAILGRPAQDFASWAAEHAQEFIPATVHA